MKFSIIGTGFIFQKHIDAIKAINGEIVEAIGEGSCVSWKKVVKNPNTDCIVILAPNYLHYPIALASAKAKKMVLCEKPLALSSKEIERLKDFPNIFTVFQLRHHPEILKLKEKISLQSRKRLSSQQKLHKVKIKILLSRSKEYFRSWKGKKEQSGGFLFNVGIHYFDLLIYLFGGYDDVEVFYLKRKEGKGLIKGKNYLCEWHFSLNANKEKQERIFQIDNKKINLSSKENLHIYVYKDLKKKKGVLPEEALKSVQLIERIYEKA